METRQRQRLLVQYAIGAYGATIRIYAGNRHLLGYFVALLTRLADGTTDRLPLEDSPLVALEGLSGLRMEVGSTYSVRHVPCRSRRDRGFESLPHYTTVALLLGISLHAAGAQQVRGVVRDDSSRLPIADATVTLPSLLRSVTTQADGSFHFLDLPPGVHAIEIRAIGFAPLQDSIAFVAGNAVQRTYLLGRAVSRLDTMHTVVPGRTYISPVLRAFEERRRRGFGHFIGEDELRKNDHKTLADVLITKIPGVMLTRGARGGTNLSSGRKAEQGRVFGNPRASLNCFVSVYMDGVLAYNYAMEKEPQDAVIRPDFSRLAVRDYAGVEFYPGAATLPPGISQQNTDCGVLLLWTRER